MEFLKGGKFVLNIEYTQLPTEFLAVYTASFVAFIITNCLTN
jgi:hypothetical protein